MIKINRIGVVGAGTMGNGIAQVFMQAGFEVKVIDAAAEALDRARGTIEKSLAKFVEKGKLAPADRDAALARLSTETDVYALEDSDYVIEAIFEDPLIKRELFTRLDGLTRPDVILASNTSSISITVLGAATRRPDKVLGCIHEPGPADVARGADSRAGDVGRVHARRAAELHASLTRPRPKRLDYRAYRELHPDADDQRGSLALMEGVGTPEAIDTVMKLGMNHPMGLLTLRHFIGLDVCLAIMDVLHGGPGDLKYARARCSAAWSPPGTSDENRARVSIATRRDASAIRCARTEHTWARENSRIPVIRPIPPLSTGHAACPAPTAMTTSAAEPLTLLDFSPATRTAWRRPGPPARRPALDEAFMLMCQIGASDLAPQCDHAPLVRKDGEMRRLSDQAGPLTADMLLRLLAEIMPAQNRAEFESRHDTDFAYEIAAGRALPGEHLPIGTASAPSSASFPRTS